MKYLNKMILVLCILTIFFITAFNFNTYQSKYISSDIKVLLLPKTGSFPNSL